MKYDSAVHRFINNVIEGNNITIFGTGEQKRNFIYIDDLLNAYCQVLVKAREERPIFGEIYNIAGKEATVKEIAEKITLLGRTILGSDVAVKYKEGRKEAMSSALEISTDKAKKDLEWELKHSLDESLESTFKYIASMKG